MSNNSHLQTALDLLEVRGEVDVAAVEFRAALDKSPSGPSAARARVGIARVLIIQQELGQAEAELRLALKNNAHEGEAHTYLGLIATLRGNLELARSEMTRGVELSPDSFVAHYDLARVLAQSDQLDQAALRYRRAIQLAPAVFQVHYELGHVLLKLDDVEGADGNSRAQPEVHRCGASSLRAGAPAWKRRTRRRVPPRGPAEQPAR